MATNGADGRRIEVFRDREVDWFSPPPANDSIPAEMAAAVQRKVIAAGPVGGSITVNTMSPGHVVQPHQHDCDEVIYVLDGDIGLGESLGHLHSGDAVAIPADTRYGFTVGPDGVRFLIIRAREASMTVAPPE